MGTPRISLDNPKLLNQLSDDDFQAALLEGVSRTFALTIPQLPVQLYRAVANAYLLCRIVDTIEDEVSLSARQKLHFCSEFIEVVKTGDNSEPFAVELAPLLSAQTIAAEHALIHVLPRVIQITHSFEAEQIAALTDCVKTMAEGMPIFQAQNLHNGLAALADMDRYCYYVAGCVGEMLTKLFCHYSPEIARHRDAMLALSVSFGQGLQMTNILKDIWDDAERGVCWLPQDVFTETGFDLKSLTPETDSALFRKGLEHLVSIAHGHLRNALDYTLLIPTHETGMRNFCLWAIGMAVLTLRKIKQNLSFNDSEQVKITRNSVKATIVATKALGRSNALLKLLFNLTSQGLATPDWSYATPSSKANLDF
ncbi:MAG: phytoene/squalene synthase family protein [Methylovulum sp.]|uniref:phytoene/squalene synthase family protein n=1 Tax=Methylovulum sp. TaxID=1916980 RepID=UPI002635D241|nr:phytoene/squalene synthase family protein [Methylovulum sp.]MDD2725175.1 phytoene/squalene synthase family protein [Methylovulum sp.]MDD5124392.1 phytoene/squalene synthase family protein [Methylovulum sp.]